VPCRAEIKPLEPEPDNTGVGIGIEARNTT